MLNRRGSAAAVTLGFAFLAFSTLGASPSLRGAVQCYLSSHVQKAAAYDSDNRKLVDDFARSIGMDPATLKMKVAATGKLACPGSYGTAQLTLSSSVITTAGHILKDASSCREIAKASSCTFTYTFAGKETAVPVASLVKNNLQCPLEEGDGSDWAVLKLSEPARGPTPYSIDRSELGYIGDLQVVAVEAYSVDFCLKDKRGSCAINRFGRRTYPETVQKCSVREVVDNYFSTDCASGQGSSGGSLLSADFKTLLGVIRGGATYDTELEIRTGKPIIRPYNWPKWAQFAVPVTGDFADTVKEAAFGKKAPSQTPTTPAITKPHVLRL